MKQSMQVLVIVLLAFVVFAPLYGLNVAGEAMPPISGVTFQEIVTLPPSAPYPVGTPIVCSLALDRYDNPHVAYVDGRAGIKYTYWNGSSWTTQIADTVGDGTSCSLALDSNGYPYITYRYLDTYNRANLKYAHWNGVSWNTQTLAYGGDFCSIAIDSQDKPHVAFYGSMSLNYASWDGAKWVFETVEKNLNKAPDNSYDATGMWVSLKLDAADKPHISYYDPINYWSCGQVKYAVKTTANWVIEEVAPIINGEYYVHTSLGLDSKGNPHIAYRGDTGLVYATNTGSGWITQTVDASPKQGQSVGNGASLTVDSNDKPHIVYEDSFRFSVLKYTFLNGSAWQINPLTPTFHGGYSISTVFDSTGKLRICRDDMSNSSLQYITVIASQLPPPTLVADPPLKLSIYPPFSEPAAPNGSSQVIDKPGCSGSYTSLALDAKGYPCISYYDKWGNQLRYAHLNGSTWYAETVDANGWAGVYSSLALDANGSAHISYLDDLNNKLKYACWNGSSWVIQTLDSIGGSHSYTSIALDNRGYPHISYFNGVNADLKYAVWNGSAWRFEVVDSSGFVGQYCSLRLDADGNPHISYYDRTNGALKYASYTCASWQIQTLQADGNTGLATSLALDCTGNPHISYIDAMHNQIKYAYYTGSDWNIQTIASTTYGDYSKYFNTTLDSTSIALNSNGYPFIAYSDGTVRNLKLAIYNGNSWVIQTVDATFDSGWTASLALDQNDRAHLSYYLGWFNGSLLYASSADNSTYFASPAPLWQAPYTSWGPEPGVSPSPTPTPSPTSQPTSSISSGGTTQSNTQNAASNNVFIEHSPQPTEPANIQPQDDDTTTDNNPQQNKTDNFPVTYIIAASIVTAILGALLFIFHKRGH